MFEDDGDDHAGTDFFRACRDGRGRCRHGCVRSGRNGRTTGHRGEGPLCAGDSRRIRAQDARRFEAQLEAVKRQEGLFTLQPIKKEQTQRQPNASDLVQPNFIVTALAIDYHM